MTLVLLAVLSQAADLLTYAACVSRYGPQGEANPLVVFLYDHTGLAGVSAFKAAVLLVALFGVFTLRGMGAPAWVGTLVLAFAVLVGLFGTATNLWALSL